MMRLPNDSGLLPAVLLSRAYSHYNHWQLAYWCGFGRLHVHFGLCQVQGTKW